MRPLSARPWSRNLAAALIHRSWDWVATVGVICPDDARGRRFGSLGPGSCLAFPPGAILGEGLIAIGAECLVGPNVSLAVGMPFESARTSDRTGPPVIVIGDRCNIGRGSSIIARVGVTIEEDVTTGPNVYITDHNHTYENVDVPIGRQWPTAQPVRIGAGSWLGAGVVVLPGTDIGRHVTVAAGSVVRGRIPERSVIVGSPARVVRRFVEGTGWVPDLDRPADPAPDGWYS